MTTNVYDSNAGLMTTDSRWSVMHGNYVLYIDDARFEKIERYENFVFMFAGLGSKIQAWKSWIRTSPTSDADMPDCEKMCICIVNKDTKEVRSPERVDIVRNGGYFAGTGSLFAYRCWSANKDARRAVESAKSFDVLSGGEVKFLDFNSGEHNLFSPANDVTINDVGLALATRGNVMEIAVNTNEKNVPFKLKDIASQNPDLKNLQGQIASGEISPTAPCDAMYSDWTEEQKTSLKSALGDVFGWKK